MIKPALILVDMQHGLDDPWYGVRNTPDAEANAARLLGAWRHMDAPIVHIQRHSTNPESPLNPGRPGVRHKPEVAPSHGEPVMLKHGNSSFLGTDLEVWLRERQIPPVGICGLTTNHCGETTARMADNLGFEATLAHEAYAAHNLVGPDGTDYPAEVVHAMSLANFASEFAEVKSTDDILASVAAPDAR